tara:strand:- start:1779 stop:2171 length:393 start_codon:yes stop_codon:yes gene_type:complete
MNSFLNPFIYNPLINSMNDLGQMNGLFNQPQSYVMPSSDPNYTSGIDFAKSIAGGQNIANMIAPGISYSQAQPMGFSMFGPVTPPVAPVEPPMPMPMPPIPPVDNPIMPPGSVGGGGMIDFDYERFTQPF